MVVSVVTSTAETVGWNIDESAGEDIETDATQQCAARLITLPAIQLCVARTMTDLNIELEAPETNTVKHTTEDPRDGTEIHLTFRADPETGKIHWEASWNDGREKAKNGRTDEISPEHGAVMYAREPKINGAPTPGSKLPDAKLDALRADLEAAQEYYDATEQAKRDAPLRFRVVKHEYRVSDYSTSDLALRPTKDRRHQTDDDRALIEEAGDLGGTAGLGDGGDPKAFGDMEKGDEFAADELRERLNAEFADEQDEREARREREADREALVDEHPELRGLSFDTEEARAAFDEAVETGESAVIATTSTECNGEVRECSTDRLVHRATPDGGVETERTHTH